ncbi:MAG: xanthine dehydrogenase family protein subunit M [Ahrensia sp.]|nr:xanthine dehydrogenase family protein subunit M [Ahrensia sp.]
MKPAAFEYECPQQLDAALALLNDANSRILAGGQSLVPMMNFRLATPSRLVDINKLPDLDYVRDAGDAVEIGALARHAQVYASNEVAQHFPIMKAAYEWIAHSAVRNRGTLCGNLCHADPASEMPAIMQVLEAQLTLSSASGARVVVATDFFKGSYETAIAADEMLTMLSISKPAPGTGWGFEEVAMRKGDYAWCTVAATLQLSSGKIASARVAVSGVDACATRLSDAESSLDGQAPDTELFANVAASAALAVDPADNVAVSADYRRDLVRTLMPRVLQAAVESAG